MENSKMRVWNNIKDFFSMLGNVIERFFYGITNFPFLVFFMIGIVGIGCIGYWIDLKLGNDVKMDLFTISMAIIGTQILNAITAKKTNYALASLGILIGFVALYQSIYGLYLKDLGILKCGWYLALLLYFFIESNDEKYARRSNSSPIGFENPSEHTLQD